MKTCKDCSNFIGAGDWNLCCKNPPERAKESWCGFLCYEDTEACENFKPKFRIKLKPDKPEYWTLSASDWIACKDCINFEYCENKEDRDGCYFGEVKDEVL